MNTETKEENVAKLVDIAMRFQEFTLVTVSAAEQVILEDLKKNVDDALKQAWIDYLDVAAEGQQLALEKWLKGVHLHTADDIQETIQIKVRIKLLFATASSTKPEVTNLVGGGDDDQKGNGWTIDKPLPKFLLFLLSRVPRTRAEDTLPFWTDTQHITSRWNHLEFVIDAMQGFVAAKWMRKFEGEDVAQLKNMEVEPALRSAFEVMERLYQHGQERSGSVQNDDQPDEGGKDQVDEDFLRMLQEKAKQWCVCASDGYESAFLVGGGFFGRPFFSNIRELLAGQGNFGGDYFFAAAPGPAGENTPAVVDTFGCAEEETRSSSTYGMTPLLAGKREQIGDSESVLGSNQNDMMMISCTARTPTMSKQVLFCPGITDITHIKIGLPPCLKAVNAVAARTLRDKNKALLDFISRRENARAYGRMAKLVIAARNTLGMNVKDKDTSSDAESTWTRPQGPEDPGTLDNPNQR
ncbi:unnamed protein product [Amoebophrya sp. A25]|nr:unnamed protein product [Amoebophrya sp. A25]|eukprot:GSA25T00011957001.1